MHLSKLFTAKELPQILEAAANCSKQCWNYLCLCLVFYCFPILGVSCSLSSQKKPMSCSLGLSLRVSSGLYCRTSGSILLAQHAKERNNKPSSIIRPFLEVFSSLSLLLLVGETGAKSPSGKGKCSAQMSCSNKPPWTSFQTGSLILWVLPSCLPPLPMSHLQTSRLRRWKQNGSSSNVSQFTVYTNTNSTASLPSTGVSQCYWGAEKHLDFLSAIKLIAF